jgi:hypothetical protein
MPAKQESTEPVHLRRRVLVVGTMLLVACGNSEVMQGEFSSMPQCLERLKISSGQELEVVTDKPDNVSGFLMNREHFGCIRKESGSRGVYYQGWYGVKKTP